MEQIGKSELWSIFDNAEDLQRVSNDDIRRGAGHHVSGFLDLAKKIAALQFSNPEHVLLFRGQTGDFHATLRDGTVRYSSLKPTLFRPLLGHQLAPELLLDGRFTFLSAAEHELVAHCADLFGAAAEKLRRRRILRWAILQHYEVCRTPLLDVTQSLRVAASFASANQAEQGFIFVLGVPNISGAVTASAEAGLQVLRLSSICPPVAVRPHIQEGFLLGEYPEMYDVVQKQHYASFEIDFSRRLIAKFRFNPSQFWREEDFPMIQETALYPNQQDPLYTLTAQVKAAIGDHE